MHTGMLWFDNSNATLSTKIQKAVDYYTKKYGHKPELCLVHPSMVKDGSWNFPAGITVRPYRPVLPGHMWIGIEDSTNLSEPKTERERDMEQ